ncbi:hypothetical protein H6784_00630 [Candidatus Nomurabacteria bacterium]|nr:hypothetical protein [Candidatus Nomurabacteria bacterium]
MKIINLHKFCLTTFFFIALLLTSFVHKTLAAPLLDSVYGGSGWSMPQSEYIGVDSDTCGSSATVGQIQLVEENSNTLVLTPPTWTITVKDSSGVETYSWTGVDTSVSPKFCYQLSSDYIKVDSSETVEYFAHAGEFVKTNVGEPADYYGQLYLGRVHLRSRSKELNNISPLYPESTSYNSSPGYIINTNQIANIYGASERHTIKHTVLDISDLTETTRNISSSGTSGLEMLPAVALPDGRYVWYFSMTLDGNVEISDNLHLSSDVPTSGITTAVPFIIDTAPPIVSVDLELISVVDGKANVTISNSIQDKLSGTLSSTIYLQEVTPGSSWSNTSVGLINGSNDKQTVSINYELTSGTSYQYFAVSTDVAGNVATSTVMNFTAPAVMPVNPIVKISSPEPTDLPSEFNIDYDTLNNINFVGEGIDALYVSWEWRMNDCNSGPVYSSSRTFSTSTTNNTITPDADAVASRIYLRAKDSDVGVWSTNCPYIDIKINCPVYESWSGMACVPDISMYPDLVSHNFMVSEGPYQKNDTVSLVSNVKNIGATDSILLSSSNFSYSWDTGETWTNFGANGFHGSIPVGAFDSVDEIFTLEQAGTLMLKHCVDINNTIDEGPLGESPNCSTIGPITVTELPEAELSGYGCTVGDSGTDSSCSGRLSWSFNNADLAYIYNLTTNTTYSTDLTGTNFIALLQYGPNVIQARNDDATTVPEVLKQITLNASCDTDVNFWDGVQCGPLPDIDISAIPTTIRAGKSTVIKIGITSDYDFDCSMYGFETSPIVFSHTASPVVQYYEYPTSELYSAQIIQISCDVLGNVVDVNTRIDIIGSPYES